MTETTEGHAGHGYTPEKANYLRRLKLIEGQTRGIARMVEEDNYCIDILTQISAIQSALKAVSLGFWRTTSTTVSRRRRPGAARKPSRSSTRQWRPSAA